MERCHVCGGTGKIYTEEFCNQCGGLGIILDNERYKRIFEIGDIGTGLDWRIVVEVGNRFGEIRVLNYRGEERFSCITTLKAIQEIFKGFDRGIK